MQLACAIAAPDTTTALAQAQAVMGLATLVEYRLDLMGNFDLQALLRQTPLPAIITCRPPAQGGRFAGSPRERQAILQQAVALGAAFIDAEADLLPALAALPHPQTRLIGSQHDFTGMGGDWFAAEKRLRALGAEVVKLVGNADKSDDVLITLEWLAHLQAPGIGIAMGGEGAATRLLAPRFSRAFLSFAAVEGAGTAPGQIAAHEMKTRFGFERVAGAAPLWVALTPWPVPWPLIAELRASLAAHATPAAWLLPIPTTTFGPGLLHGLRLARAAGCICLNGVARAPALAAHGISPAATAWRLDTPTPTALPDRPSLPHFWHP